MNPDSANSSNLPMPEPATGTADTASEPIMAANPQSVQPSDPGVTPGFATDGDKIEREWVLKTKQILLATHSDPFEQNRQLAALKADYMMKRYGKEIKLGE